eukprot:m.59461 g.59461  ORF g.59461 m.59461 type:complete len:95 (+) comp11248_c0_seq5:45-329(+)
MRSFLLVNWLCCCYVVQGMRTILFLNDAQLDMNTGARREVGEATLVSQYTDPDPSVDLTFSYPSVIAINRSGCCCLVLLLVSLNPLFTRWNCLL